MRPLRTTPTRAFTMIELIVVIVILGILAALAVPSYRGLQDRSVRSSINATLQSTGRLAEALAAQNATTPDLQTRTAVVDL